MKNQPKSDSIERYPFTDLEKRAVDYVANDDLSMFAGDDDRMIREHYYIKGAEIETANLRSQLEEERELRNELMRIFDRRLSEHYKGYITGAKAEHERSQKEITYLRQQLENERELRKEYLDVSQGLVSQILFRENFRHSTKQLESLIKKSKDL